MRRGRALAALGLLTLLWGYSWVVAKQALDYAGPFHFAFLRAFVGSLGIFGALLVWRRSMKLLSPWRVALVGLAQTGAFTILSNWALVAGGAGKTAVLVFTMPVWTLLLGRWLLGERVRGAQWFAVAGAGAGLLLILQPWAMAGTAAGKLLALAAALAWAVGTVLVKRWRAHLGGNLLAFTGWQMLFGALALLPVALAVPERTTDWSPTFFAILAFMGLGSTALGWLLWLRVLETLPAWQASLSVLGIPVVAIVSSRLRLAEPLEALELAGMLLVGAGLGLMSLISWRNQRRAGL